MDSRGLKIYNLGKRQLVESVVAWWNIENLKPMILEPQKAIKNTKDLVLREDFFKTISTSPNPEMRLLEIALTHMIVAPNMFLIENRDINEKYSKYQKYINIIKANIRNVCRIGYKYSDLSGNNDDE